MFINTQQRSRVSLLSLYLSYDFNLTMSISLDQIQHHQRILLTGKRAQEIFSHCQRVLDFHKKAYDYVLPEAQRISEGPIVFIISDDANQALEPHIALIDLIPDQEKDKFELLVDSLPKSGTVVYNEGDKVVNEICSKERKDVHRVAYKNDTQEAAKGLLKRIGINEARFNQAL